MTKPRRTENRNPDLLTLGAVLGKTLRQRPELGLIRGATIDLDRGLWITLHHDEPRPAAALLAWLELLQDATIWTRPSRGSTSVLVVGQLDGIRTTVLASFTSQAARSELAVGAPTVGTLQLLHLGGHR